MLKYSNSRFLERDKRNSEAEQVSQSLWLSLPLTLASQR